jgi:hypothetical protein
VLVFMLNDLDGSASTYLQNPPRIILVIGNTAITQSSRCHGIGIDTRIRSCCGSECHGRFLGARVVIELLVRFCFTTLLATPEEESGTDEGSDNDNANNDTSSNSSSVGTSL